MNREDKLELLIQKLRALRLIGMADSIADLLEGAAKKNTTTLDVIDQLCDEEKQGRRQRTVARRIQDARFPEVNTVDAFDFTFSPSRKRFKARYLRLHDMAFLDRGVNPLFIGTPGTGKTFLARSLAYAACQAQKRVVVISAPNASSPFARGANLWRSYETHPIQFSRFSRFGPGHVCAWLPGGAVWPCACASMAIDSTMCCDFFYRLARVPGIP